MLDQIFADFTIPQAANEEKGVQNDRFAEYQPAIAAIGGKLVWTNYGKFLAKYALDPAVFNAKLSRYLFKTGGLRAVINAGSISFPRTRSHAEKIAAIASRAVEKMHCASCRRPDLAHNFAKGTANCRACGFVAKSAF